MTSEEEAKYYRDVHIIEDIGMEKISRLDSSDISSLNLSPGSLERYERENRKGENKTNKEVYINKKKEILLPQIGKLISEFAIEVADILKDKYSLFYRSDLREIVEIGEIKHGNQIIQGFRIVKPNRLITLVENYFTPGIMIEVKEGVFKFKEKSMSAELAATILQSSQLQDSLPRIDRLFNVPIPILFDGKLTFPKKGFDERFNSWLPEDAPEISNPNMTLESSRQILDLVFQEFCFKEPQDKVNAIAALLTPFLRGLHNKFNTRTPVIFYKANRERAGKDFCAGISGIVYEGCALEESPISNSENSHGSNDELRKKILSAFIAGRKRLHFSNNKGFIDNAVLESVITAERFSDRLLGRNEIISFDNELDLSMSGNLGVTFTPDLANRCRFVNLFLDIEDANSREFTNPNLHSWILKNRNDILSALYSLVRTWFEAGKKPGKIPFASFPEWANVCGGIMESCGYQSPCTGNKEISMIGGDAETQDMKVLFEIAYARYPEQWINRAQLIQIISLEEIFAYFDFGSKSDLTKFGMKLGKFIGRVLSDIKLIIESKDARGSRQRYKFSKESGNLGNSGNVIYPQSPGKNINNKVEYNVKDAKPAKPATEYDQMKINTNFGAQT